MCLQAHTYTHFLALYVPASPPTHIFPRLAHLTCYFLAFICGRMKTEKTSVFRRTAKNLSLEELKYFTPQAVVFTPNYISSWQSKPHAIELSFFFFKEKESTNIFACAVSTIKKITLNVIFFCHHGFFFFFWKRGNPRCEPEGYFNNLHCPRIPAIACNPSFLFISSPSILLTCSDFPHCTCSDIQHLRDYFHSL